MSIELSLDQQRFSAEPGENLLDALNRQGAAIPFSCRAGQCYACLVQCLQGRPDCPPPPGLAEGWYPACQCRVREPLQLRRGELVGQSLGVQVQALDWLPGELLRLRLQTERPLRYSAGQHLLLWADEHLARPYSLASLAGRMTFWNCILPAIVPEPSPTGCANGRSVTACASASCAAVRCTMTGNGSSSHSTCWPAAAAWRRSGLCCVRRCVPDIAGLWCSTTWRVIDTAITWPSRWPSWRSAPATLRCICPARPSCLLSWRNCALFPVRRRS